jgi:hypothetical protein
LPPTTLYARLLRLRGTLDRRSPRRAGECAPRGEHAGDHLEVIGEGRQPARVGKAAAVRQPLIFFQPAPMPSPPARR